MGRINFGRLILGGIVTGIVGNILGYLVDGVMLAPQWAAGMRALGRAEFSGSQIVAFNVIGLAFGIVTLWLYAAIRPRYGAGPKTVVWDWRFGSPESCYPTPRSWARPVYFPQA